MSTSNVPPIPGLHGRFLGKRLPGLFKHATAADLKRWRTVLRPAQLTSKGLAAWYLMADEAERQTLHDVQKRSQTSTRALAKALKDLKEPAAFAEPLLKAELKKTLGVEYDVNTTEMVEIHYESVLLGSMQQLKPRQQTLMQAAMQNYAADTQFETGSALAPKGAFTLELKPGALGAYPRFQYRYSQKLEIEPERFAALCHALDLGEQYQAHVRDVYERPATQDIVRTLSISADKDRLRQAAQEAFMKGEITASARSMFNDLIDGQQAAQFNGKPVILQGLTMFGATLESVVVFSADRVSSEVEPVVVYLPGAPLYPLKEYPSVAAFKQDLRVNLLQPAYLQLFHRYVRQQEQAHFFKRLDAALYLNEGELDPHANLHLRDSAIGTDLFGYRQDQHLIRLKEDAAVLVVPSAKADEEAKKQRLAYWESISLNVLNAAAFFVPALGVVMAVVAGVQLVDEIIDGAHAWEAGDLDEALAHFESVALNVAMAVGMGAAGHLGAPIQASEQVDGLLRVTLPSGEERLWKPDLAPYARMVELADVTPDAAGVYPVDGKSYIRIETQVFEVTQDADATWTITHPDDPHAYQPVLRHNGEGTWQAAGEQPLQWNHERLLKRLGHLAHGLSDEVVEQAVKISGVDDDVLRRMYVDQLKMPPLLKDTLQRYQTDRRMDRLIKALSNGAAGVDGLGYGPSLSQELPRWPERVIEVYDEAASADSEPVRYGAKRWPGGRVIRISIRELYANTLADKVLEDLSEEEASDLFGSSVETHKRLEVLRQLIAERATKARAAIFELLHEHGRAEPSVEQARLIKAFPLLTDEAALEIIDAADSVERTQLQASDGRVPMRLAEEARVYQRQITVSRAIQGLHEVTLANLDSDRLAVGLMADLPGWSGNVRLELRENSRAGRLLASAGQPAGELKTVVRTSNGYRVYDAQDLELSKGEPLFASFLKALPDSERQALGFDTQSSQSLHSALYSLVSADRARVSTLLGQQPIKPWFRSPFRLADGRTGYPLGGTVGSQAVDGRLNALFPRLNREALEAMKARLLLENQHLGDAVFKLEAEYKTLEETLDRWVTDSTNVYQRGDRQHVRQTLLNTWRRPGGGVRAKLALHRSNAGALPVLTARFEHIHDLSLAGMQQEALPSGFLRCFPRLKRLSLEGNRLSEIPADVGALTGLVHLNVSENGLINSDSLFDVLEPLVSLQTLNLQKNPLTGLSNSALEALASLPVLTRLNFRYSSVRLTAEGLEVLTRLPLQELNLSNTDLVLDETAAQVFSRFGQLKRLNLAFNLDLGRAPELGDLTQLEQLDLKACGLSEWPEGLTTLMNLEPLQLESIDLSSNRITTLPALAETRFGAALRTDPDLDLNLFSNPLNADSIARMSIVGAAYERDLGIHIQEPVQPDDVWLEGAGQVQRDLWQELFQNRQNRALHDAFDRLALSSEFRANAAYVRKRVWSMLELASQHTQLREDLVAIAGDFPVTCGDAGADAFSALETAVLVFQRSSEAGSSGRSADLVALYKQLFRRHEVQRMADTLSLARMSRRAALMADGELTPLDPLDDISDARLASESVDDIEIRLALRQKLAGVLDYPEPSSDMLFEATANLSKETFDRVAGAVKGRDTVANRQAWMVGESSWQRYLKERYAGQFEAILTTWTEGLDYLDYCRGTSDEVPAKLDGDVVSALRNTLGKTLFHADGTLRKFDIDDNGYLKGAADLIRGREEAEAALMTRLTQVEELSP